MCVNQPSELFPNQVYEMIMNYVGDAPFQSFVGESPSSSFVINSIEKRFKTIHEPVLVSGSAVNSTVTDTTVAINAIRILIMDYIGANSFLPPLLDVKGVSPFVTNSVKRALESVNGNPEFLSKAQLYGIAFFKQSVRQLDLSGIVLDNMGESVLTEGFGLVGATITKIIKIIELFASTIRGFKVRSTKIEILILSMAKISEQTLLDLAACKKRGLLPKLKSLTILPATNQMRQPLSTKSISALVQAKLFANLIHLDVPIVNQELLTASSTLASLTVRPHILDNELLLPILNTVATDQLPSLRTLTIKKATKVTIGPVPSTFVSNLPPVNAFKHLVKFEYDSLDMDPLLAQISFKVQSFTTENIYRSDSENSYVSVDNRSLFSTFYNVETIQAEPIIDELSRPLVKQSFGGLSGGPCKKGNIAKLFAPANQDVWLPDFVLGYNGIPFRVLKLSSIRTPRQDAQTASLQEQAKIVQDQPDFIQFFEELEFYDMAIADIAAFLDLLVIKQARNLSTILLELNDTSQLLELPQLFKLPFLRVVKVLNITTLDAAVYSIDELKQSFQECKVNYLN